MKKKSTEHWLLVDCNSLAHRAWHAMMPLEYKGMQTGVIFGLLRDITMLQEQFGTHRMVFCFDNCERISLRKKEYPAYKASRTTEGKEGLYKQIDLLRSRILKDIGFQTVLFAEGYEADDWVGLCCKELIPRSHQITIVSRDHDMHQLLTWDKRITQYDPQTRNVFTHEDFVKQWNGISPKILPQIKALMGCKSDDIQGVKGVGEVYAKMYLKSWQESRDIPKAVWDRIQTFVTSERMTRNVKLVTLPWPTLHEYYLKSVPVHEEIGRDDRVTQGSWNAVCRKFGLESLIPKCPATMPAKCAGPDSKGWNEY